jgi:O-antigen/teichoic acid export membrane protein
LLIRVSRTPDGRPDLVSRCSRLTAGLMLVIIGALLLVSRPLLVLLVGAEFLPSAALMWWMAPGMYLATVSKVLMPYFTGTNRPGICSASIWMGAVANAASVFLLFPRYGITAAAMGMTIGFSLRSAIVLVAYMIATRQSAALVCVPSREDMNFLLGWGRRAVATRSP